MVLLLDNHDSFTYNLVALLQTLGLVVHVRQPEAISVGDVLAGDWQAVVISPGPGTPAEAACRNHVAALLAQRPELPVLGVCLGHQLLGLLAGARITVGPEPVHGHQAMVRHTGTGLFAGLEVPVVVMRYHSLMVDARTLPRDWTVDAVTDDDQAVVMAIRHLTHPWDGVQFHPESIGTPAGLRILRNWMLQRVSLPQQATAQAAPLGFSA